MYAINLVIILSVLASYCAANDYVDSLYLPRDKNCEGFCLQEGHCPEQALSPSGNCDSLKIANAQCCLSVPKEEYRCQKIGGECMSSCPDRLIYKQATDCDSPKDKCCYLM